MSFLVRFSSAYLKDSKGFLRFNTSLLQLTFLCLGVVVDLLKAPGCDPRKEIIGASHEGVIGLKEVHEGGSFWSVSGQTPEPVCTLHVGRREGQNILKQYLPHLKDPQAGLLEFDNEQQQEKRESEIEQARTEHVFVDEQQVLKKQSSEDELVCNLASPFCSLAASSAACLHQLEREFNELNLQETKLDAILSSSEEGNVLKHLSSPASLEGSSGFVGSVSLLQGSGEVATLSTESNQSNVGLTKLKSSLRGGYEKAGLGSRPKVHVTWAPNVYDPPCTSTSHTITRNHRRHYRPRSEHKNRHKGKGSSHSDSHNKSQKKIRKSKHSSETFISDPTLVSQRGILNNRLMLEDPLWKSAKVSPFILPPKGCFLNPVLPFCERDQVTLEKIQGCRPWHVQQHELCL